MTSRGSNCVSCTYPLSNGLERIQALDGRWYLWVVVKDTEKLEEIMSSIRNWFDYRKRKFKTVAYTVCMLISLSHKSIKYKDGWSRAGMVALLPNPSGSHPPSLWCGPRPCGTKWWPSYPHSRKQEPERWRDKDGKDKGRLLEAATSHWPELSHMAHLVAKEDGKCSLYSASHGSS